MSLRKIASGHGKSRCITRPRLGATRSSLEVQVGSRAYGYVQMNPFVKPPDPLGTREQGAALSEKQVSLRSNVTASGNAQRTDDTAAWDAEPSTYWPMAQLRLFGQVFFKAEPELGAESMQL